MWEDGIYGSNTPTDMVGYQSDGTFNAPSSGMVPNPVDAGGGAPGNYSAQLVDMFKFGVGTYAQQQNVKNNLDYKRYEATAGGLYRQGVPNIFAQGAQGQSSGLLIMAGIAIVAVVLLNRG